MTWRLVGGSLRLRLTAHAVAGLPHLDGAGTDASRAVLQNLGLEALSVGDIGVDGQEGSGHPLLVAEKGPAPLDHDLLAGIADMERRARVQILRDLAFTQGFTDGQATVEEHLSQYGEPDGYVYLYVTDPSGGGTFS